jgi:hypothetical protein
MQRTWFLLLPFLMKSVRQQTVARHARLNPSSLLICLLVTLKGVLVDDLSDLVIVWQTRAAKRVVQARPHAMGIERI